MNLVTSCVADCDQGDGSAAASAAYATCRNACISSYIITSGTAVPSASGAANAVASDGTTLTTGTSKPTGSAAVTGNGTASSTSKGSAAPTGNARVHVAGGSLGLILAAFALL